jgi:hypothetical protein
VTAPTSVNRAALDDVLQRRADQRRQDAALPRCTCARPFPDDAGSCFKCGRRIVVDHRRHPRRFPELTDPEWLAAYYVDAKLSTVAIADLLGCTPKAVRLALRRHGFRVRGLSEAGSLRHIRRTL